MLLILFIGKKLGVTVALVDCDLAIERFKYFTSLGYNYDYPQYRPHITLEYCDTDLTEKYLHLIGKKYWVGFEYFKPFYE